MTGGVMSPTNMPNEHVAVLFEVSTAVQVTEDDPSGKVAPGFLLHEIDAIATLSSALGRFH